MNPVYLTEEEVAQIVSAYRGNRQCGLLLIPTCLFQLDELEMWTVPANTLYVLIGIPGGYPYQTHYSLLNREQAFKWYQRSVGEGLYEANLSLQCRRIYRQVLSGTKR